MTETRPMSDARTVTIVRDNFCPETSWSTNSFTRGIYFAKYYGGGRGGGIKMAAGKKKGKGEKEKNGKTA